MNRKKSKKNENAIFDGDIENYASIDYSMSDVPSILEENFCLQGNDVEYERDKNKFVNVWSVPIDDAKENPADDSADDYCSTWTTIIP